MITGIQRQYDICHIRETAIRAICSIPTSEEVTLPQTCGITISGNILTNTINTRDVGASVQAVLLQI
ncbi:MAG: hypothetical protein R2942_11635 [Ignavibacteria bacterium]